MRLGQVEVRPCLAAHAAAVETGQQDGIEDRHGLPRPPLAHQQQAAG
jgi:hypothetical protein